MHFTQNQIGAQKKKIAFIPYNYARPAIAAAKISYRSDGRKSAPVSKFAGTIHAQGPIKNPPSRAAALRQYPLTTRAA
jgi:hypothetical protein